MAQRYRRVVRRPHNVDDEAWSRLKDLLSDAVSRQNRLADRCPHILRYTETLREERDGSGCFAWHEPASPVRIEELLDPGAPATSAAALLRSTLGLFRALADAHASAERRSAAHGAIVPGVLLRDENGDLKVTDFGFAQAFCNALGVEQYINLAVGPPGEDALGRDVTGVWEVLDSSEFSRDDRICAFIDPEKYGTGALETFEPGSDVIAAGFVLHLLAERKHPYLYAEPEAHRIVAMSEFMAMARFNGARRRDLRESADPAVVRWCALMTKALARLPRDRPHANHVVRSLAEVMKPEDAERDAQRGDDQIRETAPALVAGEHDRGPTSRAGAADRSVVAPGKPGGGTKRRRAIACAALGGVAVSLVGLWVLWSGGEAMPMAPSRGKQPVADARLGSQMVRTDADLTVRGGMDAANDPGERISHATDSQTGRAAVGTQAEFTIPRPLVGSETPAASQDDEPGVQAPPESTEPDTRSVEETAETSTDQVSEQTADDVPERAPGEAGEDEAQQALRHRLDELNERFTAMEQLIHRPAHADLVVLARGGSIGVLGEDMRTLVGDLPPSWADERDRVRSLLQVQSRWQGRLADYARIFDLSGKELHEQIALLEAAHVAWSTKRVEDLLVRLNVIQGRLQPAMAKLDRGEWRAAKFLFDAVMRDVDDAGLGAQLGGTIRTAEDRFARQRREHMVPLLTSGRDWLTTVGPPPDPLAHLARTDAATEARNRLDQLDLDFPRREAEPGTAGLDASRDSFPWLVLGEEERRTALGLAAWTTVSLPIRQDDGAIAVRIDFTFIPEAPAYQVLDPVWMSRTEITVAQYGAIMGDLPTTGPAGRVDRLMRSRTTHPVAFVSAAQVPMFCDTLSVLFNRRLIVRVPYVGEWQYAFSTGGYSELEANPRLCTYNAQGDPELDPRLMNLLSDEFEDALDFPGYEDGFGRYAPVGSFPPNRWFLCDLVGNVGEWVASQAGGRLDSIGGSFRDAITDPFATPMRRDRDRAYDDVGLRVVVVSAPP